MSERISSTHYCYFVSGFEFLFNFFSFFVLPSFFVSYLLAWIRFDYVSSEEESLLGSAHTYKAIFQILRTILQLQVINSLLLFYYPLEESHYIHDFFFHFYFDDFYKLDRVIYFWIKVNFLFFFSRSLSRFIQVFNGASPFSISGNKVWVLRFLSSIYDKFNDVSVK